MYLSKIFSSIIWFVIGFPYIPTLVAGTDNQPTFTLIFFCMMFFAFKNPKALHLNFINKYVVSTIVILFSTLLIGILYNFILFEKPPFLNRLFSFVQFLVAMLFGATTIFTLPRSWLKNVLWIYLIFTVVYFLTGGLVEEFLIRSRVEGVSELLANSGRGARTLSPEPSLMALHILNIILLFCITHLDYEMDYKNLILAIITLASSFSGYGFFIGFSLILIFYPRFFIGISIVSILILAPFLSKIELNGIRILMILDGLRENNINFLFQDESFNSRINSFLEYRNSFIETFPIGDSFTVFSGGGIISIISALGLIGFLFFLGILFLLLKSNYSTTLKLLFLLWLMIYFISGSFGVPLFGLILGAFIANSFKNDESIHTVSSL